MRLSVLDLVFLSKGQTAVQAVNQSIELAQFVESLGFARYWLAEHHASKGIASSSPEVLIAAIARATHRLRVGSGGILLPNHSTLHIAEVFRTLEALAPGRIDLGLGRAPGTDRRTSLALRHGSSSHGEDFPQRVADLIHYLRDEADVVAVPQVPTMPQIWILGSSDFGARLAAQAGLPYSFAQHFSPLEALGVMKMYQALFQPSPLLKKPRLSMGCHVICAETWDEAQDLALSSDLSMSIFARTGQSEPLRPVDEARQGGMTDDLRKSVRERFPKFVGTPQIIRQSLAPYLEVADELVISTAIYDPAARRRSYELLAQALGTGTEDESDA